MQKLDEFHNLVGAYYGVRLMDEYDLKVYVLKEIEEYIKSYLNKNKLEGIDYLKEAKAVEDTVSTKVKLQDALRLLNAMDGSEELIYLIRKKIRTLDMIT